MVDKLIEEFGSADIIVNNAGYTWDSVIQKTTTSSFRRCWIFTSLRRFEYFVAASQWLRETAKKRTRRVPRTAENCKHHVYFGYRWQSRAGRLRFRQSRNYRADENTRKGMGTL